MTSDNSAYDTLYFCDGILMKIMMVWQLCIDYFLLAHQQYQTLLIDRDIFLLQI